MFEIDQQRIWHMEGMTYLPKDATTGLVPASFTTPVPSPVAPGAAVARKPHAATERRLARIKQVQDKVAKRHEKKRASVQAFAELKWNKYLTRKEKQTEKDTQRAAAKAEEDLRLPTERDARKAEADKERQAKKDTKAEEMRLAQEKEAMRVLEHVLTDLNATAAQKEATNAALKVANAALEAKALELLAKIPKKRGTK